MSKDIISIVVPCHNEEEMVPIFHKEITAVSEQLPDAVFELIFVNDGSKDATLAELKRLASLDERVHYLSFSRNFGKEAAMVAGLRHATGNYVAVMDADLQDPPAMLVEMVALIRTGEYDCIGTKRLDRKGEPPIRSFFARQFYQLINRISDTEIVDGARDFRLMTRQMVDAVLEMTEYNRFSKGNLQLGRLRDEVPVVRKSGTRRRQDDLVVLEPVQIFAGRNCGLFRGTVGDRGFHRFPVVRRCDFGSLDPDSADTGFRQRNFRLDFAHRYHLRDGRLAIALSGDPR